MTITCVECGAETVWDEDVGSSLCTVCGTLTDASQTILTSNASFAYDVALFNNQNPTTTLKSFRRGSNWNLAGQSKEARERRNFYAIHDFIRSLASSLSFSALSPRAITLFDQAIATRLFKWGRKAKLIAAASLSVALREAKRPDCLHDIAYIIQSTHNSLLRARTALVSALHLTLPSNDPASHLSTLESHLSSQIQSSNTPVFLTPLKPLSLHAVFALARSLITLLVRLFPSISSHSTASTACAVVILCFEAEARAALPKLKELAAFLGARCCIGRDVIMKRYEAIQDDIGSLIKELPWLGTYEKQKNGRAKVAKRLVVARGLKDVIQWQDDLWIKNITKGGRPTLALELDDSLGEEHSDSDSENTSQQLTEPRQDVRPLKRRKTRHDHDLASAAHFLVDPLGAPLSGSFSSAPPPVPPGGTEDLQPFDPRDISYLQLSSYILTTPSFGNLRKPPTRLQLLSMARGGVSEDKIADDELFDEGEWDRICRSQSEIQTLVALGCFETEELSHESSARKVKKGGKKDEKTSKKINLDALACFMRDDGEADHDQGFDRLGLTSFGDDKDEDKDHSDNPGSSDKIYEHLDHSDVIFQDWRPPSPGGLTYEYE